MRRVITMTTRTNHPRALLALLLAAAVAAGVLVLVGTKPAQAAFPGTNGKKQKNRTNNTTDDYDSAWSPDGSKIAFLSFDDNSEIYKMNSDGTGQTPLTNNATFDGEPDWRRIPPP